LYLLVVKSQAPCLELLMMSVLYTNAEVIQKKAKTREFYFVRGLIRNLWNRAKRHFSLPFWYILVVKQRPMLSLHYVQGKNYIMMILHEGENIQICS
jgi:hypothetical protein